MPLITLNTNAVKDNDRDSNLCLAISQQAALSIEKPEAKIRVVINSGQTMSFAGSFDPCVHMKIISIGNVYGERNKNTAKNLTDLVSEMLGISNDRIFIEFHDYSG